EKQPSNLGQIGQSFRVNAVPFLSSPDRVLVELDVLRIDSTEDHPPESSIADGQRFHPSRRRLPVPQDLGGSLRRSQFTRGSGGIVGGAAQNRKGENPDRKQGQQGLRNPHRQTQSTGWRMG